MSRTWILTGVCLMLLGMLFLGTATVRAQLSEDYRFKGKVLDEKGKGIPEVQVTFHETQTGERIVFKTDKKGEFDRRMIPHGVYDVRFEKQGYVAYEEHFDWSASAPQTIEKVAQIVLTSEAEQAKKELGQKEAKLYQEAYDALTKGDCGTARKDAEQILQMGAGSYEYAVRFVIARCEAMQGETDAAVQEYQRVLSLKPDLFEAHFDLGGLLEKQGKHDEALAEYEKAAVASPTDAESEYQIGAILLQVKKEYDESRPHFQKALQLNPSHVQATKALGLADLWAKEKNIPEGVSMLKKYLELDPKAADAAQIQEIIKSFESAPASSK